MENKAFSKCLAVYGFQTGLENGCLQSVYSKLMKVIRILNSAGFEPQAPN